ncbi:MAG: lysophospholipid acyltransferase family protein [Firmicutes bacterium]|jgi:1-acyl-sn-glycerol-3-phosphate acyltransferase|nr:lysophospholipid acyltransferase family protein [Bacillota bacterium]MDD3299094.1 lysophospholipid acyltransferase family protein [Bacillota bacterium]MDD3850882.1 lysophospholipid acyltransferase family protein [Bacillota bacterium]MDD4707839.1 lysophospholipid acyltransferase family protein [Bacillota bacterium]
MLYKVVAVICKNLLRLIYRVRVEGDMSLGSVEGCIVYANHINYLDPVVMGGFSKRQIRFMAKTELYGNRFFRYILLKLGTFPVRRGEADLSAVKTSLRLLKNGEILGMFPEGTRNKSGAPMDAEPGLSMIAIKAKVPVIPMAILSSYRVFSQVRLVIGEPISLEEFYDKKLTMDHHREISNSLMGRVFTMLQEAGKETL